MCWRQDTLHLFSFCFIDKMTLLIIFSILSLPLTAACYFYSKIKLSVLCALIFFVSNIVFAHSLLYDNHTIFFYLLMAPCVMFPVSCLVAFALDVKYGIFCIDTSFSSIVAWIFSPILLPINLIILYLGNY